MLNKIINIEEKLNKEHQLLSEYGLVIENLAELDQIFMDDGSINFDATAILIERLGRAFPSFSEIAVYEFDYLKAQRDPFSLSIKALGQIDYPSVNVNEEFAPYGVKKLFLLALIAELTGDDTKLLAEFPDYYEFAEKKIHEWVTFGEKHLLFRINNWLAYFLGKECALKQEINNQLAIDEVRPEYAGVKDPLFFKELGFIPLYVNNSKIYFLMVRNLKGSIKKGELELLGGADQEMFAKMLELFISKYQTKMEQIAQRRKAARFSANLEMVIRRQYHDLKSKVSFITGRADLSRRKIAGEKLLLEEKLKVCDSTLERLYLAGTDLLEKLNAEALLQELHEEDKSILSIKKVVNEVIDNFSHNDELSGVEFKITDNTEELFIIESKNKLRSYFVNVISNSLKYFNLKENSDKRLEIILEALPAPSIYSAKQCLKITIKDNGPGLSAERAAEITANINAGYHLFPDQEMIKKGFLSHGEGLQKATIFVRENGGDFEIISLPEGGCATTIKIYVDTQDQILRQKQKII